MSDTSFRVRLTLDFWVHDQDALEQHLDRLFKEVGEERPYLSLEDSVYEATVGMTPVPMTPGAGFLDIGLELIEWDAQIVGGKAG